MLDERGRRNILVLSLAFLSIKMCLSTTTNAAKVMAQQLKLEYPSYAPNPNISLSLMYFSLSFFQWLTPIILNLFPVKAVLVFCTLGISAYPAQYLKPNVWAGYASNVLVGACNACIQTCQGVVITLNSTPGKVGKNTASFWLVSQLNRIIGSLSVLTILQYKGITKKSREYLLIFLTSLPLCASSIILLFLGRPIYTQENNINNNNNNNNKKEPLKILLRSIKLLRTRDMLLLLTTFAFAGVNLSFLSSFYSNAVGNLTIFKMEKVYLVTWSAFFIGLGEATGCLFIIYGSKRLLKDKRYRILLLGFSTLMLSYVLAYINLPKDAVKHATDERGIIATRMSLCWVCSFLIGFGDACYVTQIMRCLSVVFAREIPSAFALYKFVQTGSCGLSFFFCCTDLRMIVARLVFMGSVGTAAFCLVDTKPTYVSSNPALVHQ